MSVDTNEILLKPEEEQAIRNNTAQKLPLNPTAQGWSGAQVRKALADAIVGDDSVLAILLEKFPIIKLILDEMKAQINILFEINKTGLIVFENEAEQNATVVPKGTIAITKVNV